MVIGGLLALAIPASALARAPIRTIAPPGVSGVSQYVEDIPTAKGNRPSASVILGGGKGPGSSSGSSALSPSTQRALDRQGSAGRQAAALVDATAPSATSHSSNEAGILDGASTGPTTAVLKAMTGSAAHGGLGVLMPVLMVLIVAGTGVLALRRRHGPGTGPDGET